MLTDAIHDDIIPYQSFSIVLSYRISCGPLIMALMDQVHSGPLMACAHNWSGPANGATAVEPTNPRCAHMRMLAEWQWQHLPIAINGTHRSGPVWLPDNSVNRSDQLSPTDNSTNRSGPMWPANRATAVEPANTGCTCVQV